MNQLKCFLVLFFVSSFIQMSTAQDCPDSCTFNVPNALTSDCDHIDCGILEITSNCSFQNFSFTLYNRWGNKVFETNDIKNKFDCENFELGNYFWSLEAEFCPSEKYKKRGNLVVLH